MVMMQMQMRMQMQMQIGQCSADRSKSMQCSLPIAQSATSQDCQWARLFASGNTGGISESFFRERLFSIISVCVCIAPPVADGR
jgi:hypothetical protein